MTHASKNREGSPLEERHVSGEFGGVPYLIEDRRLVIRHLLLTEPSQESADVEPTKPIEQQWISPSDAVIKRALRGIRQNGSSFAVSVPTPNQGFVIIPDDATRWLGSSRSCRLLTSSWLHGLHEAASIASSVSSQRPSCYR